MQNCFKSANPKSIITWDSFRFRKSANVMALIRKSQMCKKKYSAHFYNPQIVITSVVQNCFKWSKFVSLLGFSIKGKCMYLLTCRSFKSAYCEILGPQIREANYLRNVRKLNYYYEIYTSYLRTANLLLNVYVSPNFFYFVARSPVVSYIGHRNNPCIGHFQGGVCIGF
jgi:hypothetical protein